MTRYAVRALFLLAVAALSPSQSASAQQSRTFRDPVGVVADERLVVGKTDGIPLYVSANWSHPLPEVTRAVLIFHGLLRNADRYWSDARATVADAGEAARGTLLIVPQFLADQDLPAHGLPPTMLHWEADSWAGGAPADGPEPLSAFDAIDAILARLADRSLFPNLKSVVIAGHSAGGQVVQRYAVVGRGEDSLATLGIHVRYVVANPSSYAYFTSERPLPVDAAACPDFNRWKYGLDEIVPYARGERDLEVRYIRRDVVYLLGTADTDPNHPALDKSCAGEAEGPHRFARGMSYFAYLLRRYPGDLRHHVALVLGVGHDGGRMFGSVCGRAALFDTPGCPLL
jgi:pimeloyl-ACP methyl ester carboxylesterase